MDSASERGSPRVFGVLWWPKEATDVASRGESADFTTNRKRKWEFNKVVMTEEPSLETIRNIL